MPVFLGNYFCYENRTQTVAQRASFSAKTPPSGTTAFLAFVALLALLGLKNTTPQGVTLPRYLRLKLRTLKEPLCASTAFVGNVELNIKGGLQAPFYV